MFALAGGGRHSRVLHDAKGSRMRRALAATAILIAWSAIYWVLTRVYGIEPFALIVFGFLATATATILVLPEPT